jgi:5-methylthioribose kinase
LNVDNLILDEIKENNVNTNNKKNRYSFKCYASHDPSKAVLIKHHDDDESLQLRYDSIGLQAFARYTPKLVPKFIAYDDDLKISIQEYLLHSYKPLQNLFVSGETDIDVATYIGTIMGRNHAKVSD